MSITPIGSGQTNTTTTDTLASKAAMGKDDFLKMFVTQLKYQDPLNPMQNQEFTAQLATFSQLEELQNLNTNTSKSLESNILMTQSINNSLATTLIGKDVKTINSSFDHVKGEGDKKISFNLAENATSVKVNIYNQNGDVIKTIEQANLAKGENSMNWTGQNEYGTEMESGKYSYKIEALNSDGKAISIEAFQRLKITGVKYVDGSAVLIAGSNFIKLGEVGEIIDPNGK